MSILTKNLTRAIVPGFHSIGPSHYVSRVPTQSLRYSHTNKSPKLFELFGGHLYNSSSSQDLKVITDIDDTVVSSGGINIFGIHLGGIDNRYKRGQFYPGVIQFALELSAPNRNLSSNYNINKTIVNIQQHSHSEHHFSLPSKIAVLTARAREFKFALALKPTGKLNRAYSTAGASNGLKDWGIGGVYYGSVIEWILHHRKGLRKFLNFEIMLKHDDEIAGHSKQKYVFVGDTGEKDEEAGERMATNYPDRIRAVFMHAVCNIHKNKEFRIPADRFVSKVPIFYFRTYVGAAHKAYRHNIITKDAVQRVAEQAITQMKNYDQKIDLVFPRSPKHFVNRLKLRKIEAQETRWKELLKDIEECSFLLPLAKQHNLPVSSSKIQLRN